VRELRKQVALVIEDDAIVVEFLVAIIGHMGFGVEVAESAEEGLAYYRVHSEETAFILLDYGIPGMHASRLLEEILSIQSDAKVLLASGYSASFISRDFPLENVSVFVPKPFEPKTLIARIEETLDFASLGEFHR
jgi:DNA-binding NtrC family response regulator